jgi:hypothetical protein
MENGIEQGAVSTVMSTHLRLFINHTPAPRPAHHPWQSPRAWTAPKTHAELAWKARALTPGKLAEEVP